MTDKEFNPAEYASDFAKAILGELFHLLEEEQVSKGPQFASNLLSTVLSSLISTMIYTNIKLNPTGNKTKTYQLVKTEIETDVAAAFKAAMQEINGNEIDYVCQINHVLGNITNKLPC